MNIAKLTGLGILVCAFSNLGFSQSFSKEVGVYATYLRDTNEISLNTSYYYLCAKDNSSKCSQDLAWTLNNDGACEPIKDGTFKGYGFVSARIALENAVSVDPTTVPKALCKSVKHVKKTVKVSLDKLQCDQALLYINGSQDSVSQVIVDNPTATDTSFRKRCAKHCNQPGSPSPQNKDLCTWCSRVDKGEALIPETHGPDLESICGSGS